MLYNIDLTNGVIFAQRVMTELINKGLPREIAYDLVQSLATKAWFEKLSFKQQILNSQIMQHIDEKELAELFQLDYFLRNVDAIFERVGIV